MIHCIGFVTVFFHLLLLLIKHSRPATLYCEFNRKTRNRGENNVKSVGICWRFSKTEKAKRRAHCLRPGRTLSKYGTKTRQRMKARFRTLNVTAVGEWEFGASERVYKSDWEWEKEWEGRAKNGKLARQPVECPTATTRGSVLETGEQKQLLLLWPCVVVVGGGGYWVEWESGLGCQKE